MTTITRQWMVDYINKAKPERVNTMVGRALVGIFRRQTDHEKATNTTKVHNNIGFTGADAYSGSMSAKSFMERGTLMDWQVERWIKPNKRGVPRIAKYHAQLNDIAVNRRRSA